MSVYILSKILCCMMAVGLAAGIVGRDPRLPVNRILGMVAGTVAFWSFLEIIWNTRADAESAVLPAWRTAIPAIPWRAPTLIVGLT